jgi:thymidylate kinase
MSIFVALEGIDGTGKTTVADILAKHFGFEHLELTQPLFRPFMDELLGKVDPNVFHMANMANLKHTSNLVDAKLLAGQAVVCARYTPTIIGYHRVMAPRKEVTELFDPTPESYDISAPDYLFHLTVDEDIRQQRMNTRGRTKVSDAMMDNGEIRNAILAEYHAADMVEINTSYLNPEEVAHQVIACIT